MNSPAITEALEQHKYLYLTTVGRKTGNPHRIEIWFTVYNHRIYLISGGGTRSDWVKNLLVDSSVDTLIKILNAVRAREKVLRRELEPEARQRYYGDELDLRDYPPLVWTKEREAEGVRRYTLKAGEIAITPVMLPQAPPVPEDVRSALERDQ